MTARGAPAASPPAPGDEARAWRAALLPALAALLVFVPALHGGFVYDDHRFLEANPHLGESSILWRAFVDPVCQTSDGTHAGLWRPLRTLSFALDHTVFGGGAAGPHAVNVLLHVAGTALLARLLLLWRAPPLAAALGATLYALHPAQVECVAWISSRGDLMSAALTWTALLLDLRKRALPAAVAGALALLSKEQAVVWPLLVPLSRVFAGRGLGDAFRGARVPVALTLAFVLVRAAVLPEALQEGGLGHGPAGPAMLASALAHQTVTTVLPARPLFDWQMPWTDRPPLGAALVALAVGAGLFLRPSRGPVAWFLAALVPTWALQAFVPLNIVVADRFLLFALPALALVGARAAATRTSLAAACGVAAAALGASSLSALPAWRDDVALWSRTAELAPLIDGTDRPHWRANAWLGDAALRAGRFEDAETFLLHAAEAQPGDAKTRYGLAVAQEILGKRTRDAGRVESALENYRAAISLFAEPRAEGGAALVPLARWAVAELLLLLGQKDEARTAFEALVAEAPPPLAPAAVELLAERRRALVEPVRTHLDAALAEKVRTWGSRP